MPGWILDEMIHKRQNAEKSFDVGLIQCESVFLQKKETEIKPKIVIIGTARLAQKTKRTVDFDNRKK